MRCKTYGEHRPGIASTVFLESLVKYEECVEHFNAQFISSSIAMRHGVVEVKVLGAIHHVSYSPNS